MDDLAASDAASVLTHDSLEFLPGYTPRLSESLRDWFEAKRASAHAVATTILIREVERSRLQADWSSVEKASAKCLSLDSFNETAVLAQAEAAAMRGGKRKAVSILDRYIAEVGVGPGQGDLQLPAALLRRRVVERIPDRPALLNIDPPFVGREAEMEILTKKFNEAREGRGSSMLLVGEPGIGKSRLSAELARFAELQGALVQRASCHRADVDRPLSLFVDTVPQLREMPGALGCAPESFAFLKRLTEFEERPQEAMHKGDSDMLFQNLRSAIFDLLDSIVEERCLLVVIEDVQWLDDASAKILIRMLERCESQRLFFLFNFRPGANTLLGYAEKSRWETMTIGPLKAAASTVLLNSVALRPGDRPEADFVNWCLEVAEGNPFFLQELAHQWIETGRRHEAPPSIAKVLQERLSRLSPEALQTLQVSAVLGEHATLERIDKVLGYPFHQVLTAVEELNRGAMLRSPHEGMEPADGRATPKHDWLSSEAMSRLAPQSLAFIHSRAADILESDITQTAMPTTVLWACANHRHQAGDRDRALALSLSCAEHLLDVGLARDACVGFQKSLEFCLTDEQRIKVLPRLAFAFQVDAAWDQCKDVLRTCIRLNAKVVPEAGSHNDFELLLLEARHQSSLEYATLLSDILPCVECVDATPAHRVRAAVMALKIATDIGPGELIDTLYSNVAPFLEATHLPESPRLEVAVVYETLRASKGISMDLLARFVDSANKADSLRYLSTLLTAASACRISARYKEGLNFAAQSVDYATSHKLTSRLTQVYICAVRLHITAREFESADLALTEATKYLSPSADPRTVAEPLLLETRIAIENGDFARARLAFGKIESAQTKYSASRKAYFFALGVHIRLMQGLVDDSLEDLVDNLRSSHAVVQGVGENDFETYALYLGLCASNQRRDAIEMVRDYVSKHRRSRWPLSPQIQCVVDGREYRVLRYAGLSRNKGEAYHLS
ncbi:MAG: ATP-binding protein [Gemmatimonadaceae bacterium]